MHIKLNHLFFIILRVNLYHITSIPMAPIVIKLDAMDVSVFITVIGAVFLFYEINLRYHNSFDLKKATMQEETALTVAMVNFELEKIKVHQSLSEHGLLIYQYRIICSTLEEMMTRLPMEPSKKKVLYKMCSPMFQHLSQELYFCGITVELPSNPCPLIMIEYEVVLDPNDIIQD